MASQSPGVFRQYRWKELGLFIIPFIILLIEMTQLFLVDHTNDPRLSLTVKNLPPIEGLLPMLGLIVALLVAHVIMNIKFPKADQMLLPIVGLISGVGVLMATRLGPDLPKNFGYDPQLGLKQLLWVIVGLGLCIAVVFLLRNINWLARYKYTWAVISLLVLIPSVLNGLKYKNAPTHDTLGIPGLLNLQPSELLKVTVIIFFAAYLSENRDIFAQGYMRLGGLRLPPLRQLGPILLMLALALVIFLVVKELGLALLIYSLFLSMMYLGSGKLSYVVVSLAVFVVLAFIGYNLLPGYARDRFAVLGLDVANWENWTATQQNIATNQGLQVVQGLIALSSGGILGAGLGLGHPTYVPVVQSDMILTALGEELGLAGLFAILGLYLLIIYRGFRIAVEATEPFTQLLAAGLTSIFAIQTLIISAGNMKLFPLTGIPLPFLSYGGSSVIANYIIIGILLRISHTTAVEREGGVV